MKITVETLVSAPIEQVWTAWNRPQDILQWNHASEDWHTTRAEVDLRVGGSFSSRMEAKDRSMGFDFSGTYTAIEPRRRIEYRMDDNREVIVEFIAHSNAVIVRETFDAELENPVSLQRDGWQAILDNFARHLASSHSS